MLKLPCENIVKYVIPSLRGEIVRSLYKKYKMEQKEIADILGLSQPSISYYINNKRGEYLEILEEYKDQIQEISLIIAKQKQFPQDKVFSIICSICQCIKKDKCFDQLK
ncbi:MAG: transcriptional regulator [Candidatus Helarchaeota archaeon]